ncbi:RsmB/NOP family class I SAM-dependent RNA methyltransferase [Thermofilum pendens]|uniref:Fmu (Sun) domain protein n=1 Tax=Thermofilum pendens (strain DSM 2475 / Hrk 5) TaxID=368408 RepID=A1RY90_THEPD|nr:RsmB/NOP family class I SAM-dependent RNA methyltransferase [Thermofilum pendens]ABL78170.1 Fmu (Sun) domain protein [Thermofilum pendens Hrk 5]
MSSSEAFLEDLTPKTFRAASLVVERVQRWKASLDYSFQSVRKEFNLSKPEARTVYALARLTLLNVGVAILALKKLGRSGIPLRRKSAFYVAVALVLKYPGFEKRVESLRGGLVSNVLLSSITPRFLERLIEEARELGCRDRIAYLYSVPPLVSEVLVENLGCARAEEVARSFERRFVWLRAVGEKGREKLEEFLVGLGIRFRRDPEIDGLYELLLPSYEPLPEVSPELAVYQDKASVAVVMELVKLGETCVSTCIDAAAAPFMKTSLYCDARRCCDEILAVDISFNRIRDSRGVLLGCRKIVHIVNSDSRFLATRTLFDEGLVDAPCTNSGAIGKDPGLRLSLWELDREEVALYSTRQREILRNVLRHMKHGGRVAYSTCSVLPEEGEEVVKDVAADGESSLLRPPLFFDEAYPRYGLRGVATRTFPDKHRSEAFFIALLEKK